MPRFLGFALVVLAASALAPSASALEREFTIYLHENPLHALPERINAELGDVLKVTVDNPEAEGKTVHNLLFCGDGKKPSESCDDRWAFTAMIQPGTTANLSVPMKKAGVFEYYCFIPGHKSGGMVGELHVAGPPAEKSGIPAPSLFAALLVLATVALLARRST